VLEAKGINLGEIARIIAPAEQTLIRWYKEYGRFRLELAKRFKELESEKQSGLFIGLSLALNKRVRVSVEY
jgi:hypothetical protein